MTAELLLAVTKAAVGLQRRLLGTADEQDDFAAAEQHVLPASEESLTGASSSGSAHDRLAFLPEQQRKRELEGGACGRPPSSNTQGRKETEQAKCFCYCRQC